jgi:hypothetical protein
VTPIYPFSRGENMGPFLDPLVVRRESCSPTRTLYGYVEERWAIRFPRSYVLRYVKGTRVLSRKPPRRGEDLEGIPHHFGRARSTSHGVFRGTVISVTQPLHQGFVPEPSFLRPAEAIPPHQKSRGGHRNDPGPNLKTGGITLECKNPRGDNSA